jgi:hypothetical protein
MPAMYHSRWMRARVESVETAARIAASAATTSTSALSSTHVSDSNSAQPYGSRRPRRVRLQPVACAFRRRAAKVWALTPPRPALTVAYTTSAARTARASSPGCRLARKHGTAVIVLSVCPRRRRTRAVSLALGR